MSSSFNLEGTSGAPPASTLAALDASTLAQTGAHRAAAKRRAWVARLHLIFLAAFVLGPLVVYPLARLVALSLAGPHG